MKISSRQTIFFCVVVCANNFFRLHLSANNFCVCLLLLLLLLLLLVLLLLLLTIIIIITFIYIRLKFIR